MIGGGAIKIKKVLLGRDGGFIDSWGNRNKGNSNNKKRIDITPLDALTIASSMINCSYTAATEGAFDESGGVGLVNVGTITVMDDLDKNPHPNPHKVSDSTRPFLTKQGPYRNPGIRDPFLTKQGPYRCFSHLFSFGFISNIHAHDLLLLHMSCASICIISSFPSVAGEASFFKVSGLDVVGKFD